MLNRKNRLFLNVFMAVGCWMACGVVLAQVEYTSSMLRDPFIKQLPRKPARLIGAGGAIEPPKIEVESLVAGGNKPLAIIEGKIVKVGDKVKEAIISNITKDGVEVLYKGEAFLIPSPASKLKPRKAPGGTAKKPEVPENKAGEQAAK